MTLLGFITSFFSVYGLLRVFTMEMPFYIFAILVPFLLMPIISMITIFYYTLKLLFIKTRFPDGSETPNIKGIEFDKLVIVSFIITYILSRIPKLNNTFKYIKIVLTFVSLFLPLYYTWNYDFFFTKDKNAIGQLFQENAGNLMYLVFFILCIFLFAKYS